MKELGALALVSLLLWLWFGHPLGPLAGVYWSNSPAPWEKVNAYYFPERNDTSKVTIERDIPTLEECRTWGRQQERKNPTDFTNDYLCGVGCSSDKLSSCRFTTK